MRQAVGCERSPKVPSGDQRRQGARVVRWYVVQLSIAHTSTLHGPILRLVCGCVSFLSCCDHHFALVAAELGLRDLNLSSFLNEASILALWHEDHWCRTTGCMRKLRGRTFNQKMLTR